MSEGAGDRPVKDDGKSCWKRPTIVVKLLWFGVSVAAIVLDLVFWTTINNGFYQHFLSLYSGTILLCSVAFAAVGCVLLIMMMFEVRCIMERKFAALICSVLEGLVSFGLAFYFWFAFGRAAARDDLEDKVIATYAEVVWDKGHIPEANGYLLWFMEHEMVGNDVDSAEVWLERVHSWASSATTTVGLVVIIGMTVFVALNLLVIGILSREPDNPDEDQPLVQ